MIVFHFLHEGPSMIERKTLFWAALVAAVVIGRRRQAATFYWSTTDGTLTPGDGTWDTGISIYWSASASGSGTRTSVDRRERCDFFRQLVADLQHFRGRRRYRRHRHV